MSITRGNHGLLFLRLACTMFALRGKNAAKIQTSRVFMLFNRSSTGNETKWLKSSRLPKLQLTMAACPQRRHPCEKCAPFRRPICSCESITVGANHPTIATFVILLRCSNAAQKNRERRAPGRPADQRLVGGNIQDRFRKSVDVTKWFLREPALAALELLLSQPH